MVAGMSTRERRRSPGDPSSSQPFFSYATGLSPRRSTASKKPPKDKKPPKPDDVVTTMAVGEEGAGTPPPGPTTPAMGEEGTGNVPTTTIAKGEESGG